MSKIVENALKGVQNSNFQFLDDGRSIEILNAVIFWTNFRGEANRFGNTARTFNVALSPEMAMLLREQGWRIREYPLEEQVLYFVNIKVNMSSNFPPVISLYSDFRGKRSKRALDVESMGELDRIDIQSADCIINVYQSEAFPGKISGYLKKLNVIQEPNVEFGGKYDDWIDEEYDCLAAGTCSIDEYTRFNGNYNDILIDREKRRQNDE